MKHWVKTLFVLLLFSLIFLSKNTFAHPGNTASDGCHYCRTNCDSWGVPWNERHCHGSGTVETVKTVQPTQIPVRIIPTSIPTSRPIIPTATAIPITKIPTLALTPTYIPTSISTITQSPTLIPTKTEEILPTSQPQVLGETNTKEPEPATAKDFIIFFSILGLFGFGVYKLIVNIKNKIIEIIRKKQGI